MENNTTDDRLEQAIAKLSAEHEPPLGWESRVLAAIEPKDPNGDRVTFGQIQQELERSRLVGDSEMVRVCERLLGCPKILRDGHGCLRFDAEDMAARDALRDRVALRIKEQARQIKARRWRSAVVVSLLLIAGVLALAISRAV